MTTPAECCETCIHFIPDGVDEYGTGVCELLEKEKSTVGYCEWWYDCEKNPFEEYDVGPESDCW